MKFIQKVSLLLVAAVFLLPYSIPAAFAETTASDADATGWVEVKCSVPGDFHDPVTVVMQNDATYEIYTVDCREENGYIGRGEFPLGNYTIFMVDAADDRPASCDIGAFALTSSMRAAQLIQVTVEDATGATLLDDPESAGTDVPETTEPMPDNEGNPSASGENPAEDISPEDTAEDTEESRASSPVVHIATHIVIPAVLVVAAGFAILRIAPRIYGRKE